MLPGIIPSVEDLLAYLLFSLNVVLLAFILYDLVLIGFYHIITILHYKGYSAPLRAYGAYSSYKASARRGRGRR